MLLAQNAGSDQAPLQSRIAIQRTGQPVQVAFIPRADWHSNEFGCVVGMHGENAFFQRGKSACRGFEDKQHFGSMLEASLPPIMRFDFRNQVDTGGQVSLERRLRKLACRL